MITSDFDRPGVGPGHIRRVPGVYWSDTARGRNATGVDEREWLAERFEKRRTRLRAVAFRMLGSVSEADDAVQDAWLRLSRADTGSVQNLDAWLTTVVARVCRNMLRSRERRREEPLKVYVPTNSRSPLHEAPPVPLGARKREVSCPVQLMG